MHRGISTITLQDILLVDRPKVCLFYFLPCFLTSQNVNWRGHKGKKTLPLGKLEKVMKRVKI